MTIKFSPLRIAVRDYEAAVGHWVPCWAAKRLQEKAASREAGVVGSRRREPQVWREPARGYGRSLAAG
ncbi:MAG: hypothetical protein R3202_12860 [Candidatus Competibacterales bacterium]|nr:hypothetical protein [Candidatus Competibacterales bacterium]